MMTLPTPRQLTLLALLAETDSTKEAAAQLGIAEGTAKNYLSEAYARLEVDNRLAAFRKLGWLRPDIRSAEQRLRVEAALELLREERVS